MLHPKRIFNKIEPSSITLSQSFTLKCNIVSDAESTPESSKSDLEKTEKSELPQQEFREMQAEKSSTKIKENENILTKPNNCLFLYLNHVCIYINYIN